VTDDQTGIIAPGKGRECARQVTRTQLGRSTSAAGELGQAEELLA
jgi:hypothetical protein